MDVQACGFAMGRTQQRYFHVVVCTSRAAHTPVLLFADLDESQLRKQFLKPYRKGGTVLAGGQATDVSELVAVKIVATPHPKKTALEALQQDSLSAIEQRNLQSAWPTPDTAAYGWDDEDVMYAGEDVTLGYIAGGPRSKSALRRALRGRWSRVIAGAMVLLAMSALLDL